MPLNQMGLGFVFTARDLASGVIERVQGSFEKLEAKSEAATHAVQSSFARFGEGLAVFAAGAAAVGSAFELAQGADRFQNALEQAGAVARASEQELAKLREAALDVGLKGAGDSATEAAEALRQLAEKGLAANEAAQALAPSLLLVDLSMGRMTREQSAGLLVDTLHQFHLGAAQAGQTVDQLAVAMRTFGIRAHELEPALRGVASGVALTGASFDDTLIALGLTKSAFPSAEYAARSVNLAFQQLASKTTRRELAALGVTITDQAGRMRPLVDLLGDLNARTAHLTEGQRAAALSTIFSARAGGGLTVIMDALRHGVRDASGQVLKGAAAVAMLRQSLASAGGAAQAFKDRLLDTFSGQKKALEGVLSTLATVVGEPFAEVFNPIVAALRDLFLGIARFVAALPAPVKRFVAVLVVAGGAIVALGGGLIAAQAGAALLGTALGAVGLSVGGLATALLPALGWVALAGVAIAGLVYAVKHDLGGLGSAFANVWRELKLGFLAVVRLFTQGGFSGAVREELDKAGNGGLKRFAIEFYQAGYRVERFFHGLAEGFEAAIAEARPVFVAFTGALRELGQAFGGLGQSALGAAAAIPSDRFAAKGAAIGEALAKVVTVVADALTDLVHLSAGIIAGLRQALTTFQPVFGFVGQALGFLAESIRGLIADVTGLTGQARGGASVWTDLGEVLGWVAGTAITALAAALSVVAIALRTVVALVRGVVEAFVWLGTTIGETAARLYLFFAETLPRAFHQVATAVRAFFQPVVAFIEGVADSIRTALDRLIAYVGHLASKIPERFRPALLDSVVAAGEAAQVRLDARTTPGALGVAAPLDASAATATPLPWPTGATTPLPAATELSVRRELSDQTEDALLAQSTATADRPIDAHVTLTVDGETLARATARAQRGLAVRSFVPVMP